MRMFYIGPNLIFEISRRPSRTLLAKKFSDVRWPITARANHASRVSEQHHVVKDDNVGSRNIGRLMPGTWRRISDGFNYTRYDWLHEAACRNGRD